MFLKEFKNYILYCLNYVQIQSARAKAVHLKTTKDRCCTRTAVDSGHKCFVAAVVQGCSNKWPCFGWWSLGAAVDMWAVWVLVWAIRRHTVGWNWRALGSSQIRGKWIYPCGEGCCSGGCSQLRRDRRVGQESRSRSWWTDDHLRCVAYFIVTLFGFLEGQVRGNFYMDFQLIEKILLKMGLDCRNKEFSKSWTCRFRYRKVRKSAAIY